MSVCLYSCFLFFIWRGLKCTDFAPLELFVLCIYIVWMLLFVV